MQVFVQNNKNNGGFSVDVYFASQRLLDYNYLG